MWHKKKNSRKLSKAVAAATAVVVVNFTKLQQETATTPTHTQTKASHSPVVILKSEQELVSPEHEDLVPLPIGSGIARHKVWLFPVFIRVVHTPGVGVVVVVVARNTLASGNRMRYIHRFRYSNLTALSP